MAAETPVSIINITEPLKFIGKEFTGPYGAAQDYIIEVQNRVAAAGVDFVPHKIFGAYYDNPETTPADKQRSFHGLVPVTGTGIADASLSVLTLKGDFLYTKLTGDPMESIMKGYGDLFAYIESNQVTLKSNTGYQVMTFADGEITTEIYMEK